MNKDILKKELDKLGVNPNEYSLNGNIESDKIVLYQNYSKWEVFYFDERGGRNCEKVFCNEEDACLYISSSFSIKEMIMSAKRFAFCSFSAVSSK